MATKIKTEIWNHKRVVVARNEKGQLMSWTKKGKINVQDYRNIYKKNLTFKKSTSRLKLINVSEYTIQTKQTNLKNFIQGKSLTQSTKTKGKFPMYQVEGLIGKEKVVARSQRVSKSGFVGDDQTLITSKKQAIKTAWENFARLVDQIINGGYDPDSGIDSISKVTNIREGWVYYA